MPGRVRGIIGHQAEPLSAGWELRAAEPGAIAGPEALGGLAGWLSATTPSTAAAALRAAGAWSLDGPPRRFDAEEWWYRTRFTADKAGPGEELWLCFDGLATVADVWLNGGPILTSTGMFTAHECRVDTALQRDNELVIRFRALDAVLKERRPRPRWKAPMVEQQQIRWFRTTLLGRTPGWSPPAAAVGPWRAVRLERRRGVHVSDVRLRAMGDGRLEAMCRAASLDGSALAGAEIEIARDGRSVTAALKPSGQGDWLTGQLAVPDVATWWPHTHGDPALYSARLRLRHAGGSTDADLGSVGFRSVDLVTEGGDFAVRVNGAPVFCRGACWTPLDPVSLAAGPEALERSFAQVVDAGMNMLRVGGTMVYESDAFLDQCDARGVLLWQDFMYANLDYPDDDAAFVEAASVEARQFLARVQGRPALAVLCGNSEAEQQAAMWGAPRERWQPALFHGRLAALSRDACPDVPYWPSSGHGGIFPHLGSEGSTSYFGVGAYLRPLEDARRAEVRFASECLAFANIPEPHGLAAIPGGLGAKVHDPAWRTRAPRDLGAGWDFDDVRDHYVAALFRLDPAALRYADHERYLNLGRVASGEVMAAVFAEWRRRRSRTRGGLIWFLTDLWPGAGWGVVDASGAPKAAWHYLRRALAPVAVSLSDEGGNGIGVHLANDRPAPFSGELEVTLYRAGEVRVAQGTLPVTVAANAGLELNAAAFFEGFWDLSYAYRFGPPSHDLIVAVLKGSAGAVRARAFHFVLGLPNARERDVGLAAEATARADGAVDLVVRTRRFAQSVSIDVDGYAADDNYFHLAPGEQRHLVLRPVTGGPVRGAVRALNAEAPANLAGPS